MKRKWLRLGGLMLIVIFGIYFFISFLIFRNLTQVERKLQVDTPENHGLAYQNIKLKAREDKIVLDGWYMNKPENKMGVVLVNGIGSTRSDLQRVDLAARLANRGFNVLMFDLRGHGSSEGDLASGGYFEQADVLGAFDFVRQQGTPPACIGILGASMGAAATILAASDEPLITAVVDDSSYADIADLIEREITIKSNLSPMVARIFIPGIKIVAKLYYRIDINSLKPVEAVTRLPYPVLIIHGLADQRIPVDHSQRMAAMAFKGSDLWLVPEAEHANAFAHRPQEYTEKVVDYFTRRFSEEKACESTKVR